LGHFPFMASQPPRIYTDLTSATCIFARNRKEAATLYYRRADTHTHTHTPESVIKMVENWLDNNQSSRSNQYTLRPTAMLK
jgi:hypothetical protein